MRLAARATERWCPPYRAQSRSCPLVLSAAFGLHKSGQSALPCTLCGKKSCIHCRFAAYNGPFCTFFTDGAHCVAFKTMHIGLTNSALWRWCWYMYCSIIQDDRGTATLLSSPNASVEEAEGPEQPSSDLGAALTGACLSLDVYQKILNPPRNH
jgi:hypothetical protein